jgi:hypothetical protein
MFRLSMGLALFVLIWPVHADQPPAKQPTPVVVQSPSTVQVQDDRGSNNNPVIIKGAVSVEKTDEDKSAEAKKAQDDHELTAETAKLAKWTVVLGIGSVVTAIFTLISIILTKMAADVLPKLERAYLFVTVEVAGFQGTGPAGEDVQMRIKIRFYNHGKTPAILKGLRYDTAYDKKAPESLLQHDNADRELPEGLVIGAKKPFERTISHRLNAEELVAIRDVVYHVYVIGLMKYEDVIGDEHVVSFCWMSQPQANSIHKNEFAICRSPLNRFT